jgi:hypothetical protein
MVTGAVAAIVYGEPRLTHDIDLVMELKTEDTEKMVKSFSPEEFYCPPEESIKLEMKRASRGHFYIIHFETGFKADCYLMGQDELHHWGMSNRREFIVEGEPIWVAPPEYVILRKLEYYRVRQVTKAFNGYCKYFEDFLSSDRLRSASGKNQDLRFGKRMGGG